MADLSANNRPTSYTELINGNGNFGDMFSSRKDRTKHKDSSVDANYMGSDTDKGSADQPSGKTSKDVPFGSSTPSRNEYDEPRSRGAIQ
ncbi:Fc.00g027880.m01.CDS01 [Cosmosporella sp. VM-42]